MSKRFFTQRVLLTIVCISLANLGCRKDQNSSCVQQQISTLLKQVHAISIRKRPSFLRRQLVQRCSKLPDTFVHILHNLGTKNRNKLDDAYEKALHNKQIQHSKKFTKKLTAEYKRYRRKGCTELQDKDFIRIVKYFTSQKKIVALTNICKKQAEQFLSQQNWIHSFRLNHYITVMAAFVGLRELGISKKQAIEYIKLAGLSQSHYKDIPLLASHSKIPMPYPGDKTTISIHNNKISYNGFSSTKLENGYRIQRKKKLIHSLYRAGQREAQRRKKMCKHHNNYSCFPKPQNTRENKQRKAWKELLSTRQRKLFPFCSKCSPRVKKWYLYIHPNTRYETIIDVLYTAELLGWKGAHIVTGQSKVPFIGTARTIPISFYQQAQSSHTKFIPKTMLHIVVGNKTLFFLRKQSKKKSSPRAGLTSLLHQNMGKINPGGIYEVYKGKGYLFPKHVYGYVPLPKANIIQLQHKGSLSKKHIKQVLNRYWYQLHSCYELERRHKRSLMGRISVNWQVTQNGRTQKVHITKNTMNNRHIASCVREHIRKWRFARSKRRGMNVIKAIFKFIHPPRKPRQYWSRFDSFIDAEKLTKRPNISKYKQLFISAQKDLKFNQLLSKIESIRNTKGKLPQIWLTRLQ